jgi:hypothetical protein
MTVNAYFYAYGVGYDGVGRNDVKVGAYTRRQIGGASLPLAALLAHMEQAGLQIQTAEQPLN